MTQNWNQLTPEQKAAEFDASHNNPTSYATANFTNTTATNYDQARTEQRAQQEARRTQ